MARERPTASGAAPDAVSVHEPPARGVQLRPTVPPGLRIAVLDGDEGFLRVLGKRLERGRGEQVVVRPTVTPEAIAGLRVRALVVDLATVGPNAWEWLARVCRERPELAVVVCTASSTVAQRVRGLRLGVDDWLSKPCHPAELIARVEAVIRGGHRSEEPRSREPIVAGELELRGDQYEAFVAGRAVGFTRREFELIELLAGSGERVLEREYIYQRLWGYPMTRGDRSVDVFVRKLRYKLERASPDWQYIHTHFGIGYRFRAEPADRGEAPGRAADREVTEAGRRPQNGQERVDRAHTWTPV